MWRRISWKWRLLNTGWEDFSTAGVDKLPSLGKIQSGACYWKAHMEEWFSLFKVLKEKEEEEEMEEEEEKKW